MRAFRLPAADGKAALGELVTICPERFEEGGLAKRWVAETLLGCSNPAVVTEVDFLRRPEPVNAEADAARDAADRAVGRIDCVLVDPAHLNPLSWCALEVQAVYFSGDSMQAEFSALAEWDGNGLPRPRGRRRPDWRSSGPKRLMPQLQIKVPSLRRWGKKMAVLVDEPFFRSLAPMEEVRDVSSCDIAWFVARYRLEAGAAHLERGEVHLTTLERAVEGLTAGVPVSLTEFETRIRSRLPASG